MSRFLRAGALRRFARRQQGAVILETHGSRDLRENRVVLAAPGVDPGLEAAAPLPDDDRAAGHDVAVVRFHAEPLRVRVAAVA